MIGPRHRRLLVVVVGVLSFLGAACSVGDETPAADDERLGRVETADAATASAARTARFATAAGGEEEVSADNRDSPVAGGDDRVSDNRPASDDPPPPEVTDTANPYPEIGEEIVPAAAGVRALLTTGGVLLAVAGQTSAGYVVETPCGGITQLDSGLPITDADVVLDPGHGGDEPGAVGQTGLTEAELNLSVAERTAAVLGQRSISVVLTRNADYRIPIRGRAALADAIAPRAFVSIHHNTPSSRPSTVPGTEVYVQSTSAQSLRLGGLLHQEVLAALTQFDVEWTARDDAGVLVVLDDEGEDAYGIARYPATTSALIEMAYLGNEKEAVLLATPDYVEVAAVALADGIERFLTTDEFGSEVVAQPRLFNPSGVTGGSGGCVDPILD